MVFRYGSPRWLTVSITSFRAVLLEPGSNQGSPLHCLCLYVSFDPSSPNTKRLWWDQASHPVGSSDSVSVRVCGLLCCSVPVLTTLTFQSDHCSGSFNSLPCSLLLLPFQHSPYLVLLKLSSSIKLFTCQKPSSWPSRPFQTCLHRPCNFLGPQNHWGQWLQPWN